MGQSYLTFLLGLITLLSVLPRTVANSEDAIFDKAYRLHNRIAGVPPSSEQLHEMVDLMGAGKVDQAAFIPLQRNSFYQDTLQEIFNFTDPERTLELDGYKAFLAGIAYQNQPFKRILYGDLVFTSSNELSIYLTETEDDNENEIVVYANAKCTPSEDPLCVPCEEVEYLEGLYEDQAGEDDPFFDDSCDGQGLNPLRRDANGNPIQLEGEPEKVRAIIRGSRWRDNSHFSQLQEAYPSSWVEKLEARTQEVLYNSITSGGRYVPPEDRAGLFSLRDSAELMFTAGTNRRGVEMIMDQFLCRSLDQLHDVNLPDNWVRKDIDRTPGGDSHAYTQGCAGCHAGMDGLANAMNHMDYDDDGNEIRHRSAGQSKLHRMDYVYPDGLELEDKVVESVEEGEEISEWRNYWAMGQNASLGWRTPSDGTDIEEGKGVKDLGKVLAATEAFGNCASKRVFEHICNRSPTPNEQESLEAVARSFEEGISNYSSYSADGEYNIRALVAQVSNMCFGGSD